MKSFKPYCIGAKRSLGDINPADTYFKLKNKQAELQRLEELAVELDGLQNILYAEHQRKVLLVLQGLDTSGKDGTIRWVFSRTSPLGVRVAAFKAPSEIEKARDFLWRCHMVVPGTGELAVWNRSHYEDVLVPVVEGWIDAAETQRRYAHINNFERLLVETGTTVIKCMLHISKEEQKKRLQDRLDDPDKHWKFSIGDLHTRSQWDDYQRAYAAMLQATSTSHAPWYVIPADNKRHRNLMIAQLLNSRLRAMKLQMPSADPALKDVVID
ncbi:polyphosphate kinase 2 family protein [Corticibacter populi]|uniref:Polyphosphate kinase 2 family protein n=1 Tax=Corticibacter populi TaxID=1550736 RepID=A0A3M6QR37_9BURK|nr:PPK2 family polyphosphate kinase [Corticibacter populi]RMX05019.1 polyphosphate kinase 2 family protein [Corticibacter populi]RZS33548.1 PPK2 family polyphosphate:nucleotide phosphotransferase [Corticibacter populi]